MNESKWFDILEKRDDGSVRVAHVLVVNGRVAVPDGMCMTAGLWTDERRFIEYSGYSVVEESRKEA